MRPFLRTASSQQLSTCRRDTKKQIIPPLIQSIVLATMMLKAGILGTTVCLLILSLSSCCTWAFVAYKAAPCVARKVTGTEWSTTTMTTSTFSPSFVTVYATETSQIIDSTTESWDDGVDTNIDLLQDAISFNSTAAAALLAKLEGMRQQGRAREDIDRFLDCLLSEGPDSPLPIWTRWKRLAGFSRRARLASLRRALDMTTPPPSESEDETQISKENKAQRRRRALVSVLRALSKSEANVSNTPAIVSFEKNASKAMKEDSSVLRNRLPEGLETPDYEIVAKRGKQQYNVEIRRYKPFTVCAVSMNKPRPPDSSKTDATVQMPEMGGASSFGALAGYLFGKNMESKAMKMTTPVFTSRGKSSQEKEMAFVLPSQFWEDEKSAPQPLSESGVALRRISEENRTIIMFGGYASKKEVEKRKRQLMDALEKDKEWKPASDDMVVAQYNDPFTVPWRRLNEISVTVVPR